VWQVLIEGVCHADFYVGKPSTCIFANPSEPNSKIGIVDTRDRAYLALEEAARAALTDHVIEWDGKPVKSIKKAIRMAAKRSGISSSPHVFRHTAGVWMAQADVPMQKISQFLGHTSTRASPSARMHATPRHS
jgi:integrase